MEAIARQAASTERAKYASSIGSKERTSCSEISKGFGGWMQMHPRLIPTIPVNYRKDTERYNQRYDNKVRKEINVRSEKNYFILPGLS